MNILTSFRNNDVGHICRTDPDIRLIGRKRWQKDRTKVDKTDEVRKSVMADMRNLASLFLEYKKTRSNNSRTSLQYVRNKQLE